MVYVSSAEAAKKLGCGQVTVRRAARKTGHGVFLSSGKLAAISLDDLPKLQKVIRPTSGNPNWIDAAKRRRRGKPSKTSG
ncbi:hypothetical protein UFOVP898_61 [uncultured Caudovirales phage]|uniref:Helix-turn-helix domain-containing protein n=1 Tax=uncultured Caudovirales phage TaxID=2100421 RepID=A0A6J5SAH7_9CAUD|nr:hypothetical protein UFOVP898_61 [uncultured Caudovirales phage]CAB4176877.1 hypothetical protein UFOVP985_72 [uncultured Caudovirales phage]CAB4181750.1 hypothetical protein UFOVP1073_59 [uncultured Caudovirales phage]CAB4197643.1 hypothetical protein UFOVP1308_24 [uncultured Caudovirales phage]CAB4210758.1 hypothetical protein UFOVP1423_45 [uncultured Caudovirales phage]